MSLLCRLKKLVHKGELEEKDLERIVIIPKEQENKVIKMREATPEERESIAKYINNMSNPTGVSFENLKQESCDDMVSCELFEQIKWERDVAIEQLKELGYALGQKIEPCEDCISRAETRKHIYQRLWESALNNVGYECKAEDVFMDIADNRLSTWISELPSIQPKPKADEPMQVELEGDGYADGELVYDYGKCPKCGWDFEYGDKDWEEPYCCHCGQKLHWFESEDKE